MKSKLRFAWLCCVAVVLMSPRFVLATAGVPIQGIPVGLEGDPGSIIVATTKTDADGKFEFKGLKAGKYRLVILPSSSTKAISKVGPGTVVLPTDSRDPSPQVVPRYSGPGDSNLYLGTIVADGAQLQLQGTFTITVTAVNDAPALLLRVNPDTGRSDQPILIDMDGGAIRGSFKIAENNSPVPGVRKAGGKDIEYKSAPEGLVGTAEREATSRAGTADGGVWKNVAGPTVSNVNGTGTLLLGVTVQPATGGGLSLSSVADGGLAQRLGLQQGDLLLAINGNKLNTYTDLVGQLQIVANQLVAAPGAPTEMGRYIFAGVTLDFLRVQQPQTVELRRKNPAATAGVPDPMLPGADIGAFEFRTKPNPAVATPLRNDNGQSDPTAGRYKQLPNGKWLYLGLDGKWLIHENGQWLPYTAPVGNRVHVAAGDVNGDGRPDLPKNSEDTGSPRVGLPGGVLPGLNLPGLRKPAPTNTTPGRTGTGGNTGGAPRSPFRGK